MRPCLFVHAFAIGACLAHPAAAADRMAIYDYGNERNFAAGHVGVTISLLQSRDRQSQPGLRFGAGLRYRPQAALSDVSLPPSMFEFRWSGTRPDGLYIGGRSFAATDGNGGLKTGQVALIVAGIAVSAFLVTQLASSDDDNDDERCFIEPELCD